MLHIVKHHRILAEVLSYSSGDDTILLTEDAIYAALAGHECYPELSCARKIYCLSADVAARGVEVAAGINLLDFDGFVRLTELHTSSLTWD